MIDVMKLLTEGHLAKAQKNMKEEAAKLGSFRGGTIGMVSEERDTVGTCMRLALLRYLGFYKTVSADRIGMFQAGETNEDSWISDLKESSFTGKILTQEQVGITAVLPSGMTITGRPDIVLQSSDNSMHGIELKQICSVWTARDIMGGQPKLHHAIQAGFYSMCLDIPYDICYTNRSDFAITGGWAAKMFPKKGEFLARYCEYSDKDNAIKKVLPFTMGFNIEWRNGVLWFRQVDQSGAVLREWSETIVTQDRIIRYYAELEKCVKASTLPSKPTTLDIFGEKANYTACQYCELALHCEKFGSNKVKWLENLPKEFTKLVANAEPVTSGQRAPAVTCKLDPVKGTVSR